METLADVAVRWGKRRAGWGRDEDGVQRHAESVFFTGGRGIQVHGRCLCSFSSSPAATEGKQRGAEEPGSIFSSQSGVAVKTHVRTSRNSTLNLLNIQKKWKRWWEEIYFMCSVFVGLNTATELLLVFNAELPEDHDDSQISLDSLNVGNILWTIHDKILKSHSLTATNSSWHWPAASSPQHLCHVSPSVFHYDTTFL